MEKDGKPDPLITRSYLVTLTIFVALLLTVLVGAMVYLVLKYNPSAAHGEHVPQDAALYYELVFKLIGLFSAFVVLSISVILGLGMWHIGSGRRDMTEEFQQLFDRLRDNAEIQVATLVMSARQKLEQEDVGRGVDRAVKAFLAQKGNAQAVLSEASARGREVARQEALTLMHALKPADVLQSVVDSRYGKELGAKLRQVVEALPRKANQRPRGARRTPHGRRRR